MTVPVTLHLDEVRSALTQILVAVEELLGSEVDLTVDHYWHLPVDAAFDMTQEPTTLTVGQVSDDVAHLQELDKPTPETVWHDLTHLTGLLRALERAALR